MSPHPSPSGVRESGKAFAAPMYMFIFGILLMVVTGLIKVVFGHTPVAESAHYSIMPTGGNGSEAGIALQVLGLKAFAGISRLRPPLRQACRSVSKDR